MQIIVTTRRIQKKKHKKKRINKKWAKLYGFTEYEVQEKGKPIVVGGRGQTATIYVTLYDYERLMRAADIVFGNFIPCICLPTEKELKHLEWLSKNYYKKSESEEEE